MEANRARMASRRRRPSRGFTIVELMVVAALIGVLAAIAIPNFLRYQARSKAAEAKTNLASIRVAEEAFFTENDAYSPAAAEPPLIPGTQKADFDAAGSDFAVLGWAPEGRVFFSYAVVVAADGAGYTIDAGADTDGDGFVALFGYAEPDGAGAVQNGAIGCDVAFLVPKQVGRCGTDETIF